jgi:hypothetical protein
VRQAGGPGKSVSHDKLFCPGSERRKGWDSRGREDMTRSNLPTNCEQF